MCSLDIKSKEAPNLTFSTSFSKFTWQHTHSISHILQAIYGIQCYEPLHIAFSVYSHTHSLAAPWVHMARVAPIRMKSPAEWVCQCHWIKWQLLSFYCAPPPLTNIYFSIFNTPLTSFFPLSTTKPSSALTMLCLRETLRYHTLTHINTHTNFPPTQSHSCCCLYSSLSFPPALNRVTQHLSLILLS